MFKNARLLVLAVTLWLGLGTLPGSAANSPQLLGAEISPQTRAEREPVYVALLQPSSPAAVLKGFEDIEDSVMGFRHEQEFVGEYAADESKSLASNVAEYVELIKSDFGTEPRIVGIYVSRADEALAEQLAIRLPTAARAVGAGKSLGLVTWRSFKAKFAARRGASKPAAISPSDLPATPVWAPNTYNGRAYETSTRAKFYSYLGWTWSNHSPRLAPLDWGFEYDWSLYNSSLTDTRPNCASNNDTQFWASRNPEIVSWSMWVNGTSLNGSDEYGAYLDANDVSDDCSRLGFAVGIGFPLNLPLHAEVQVIITAHLGALASSPYAIQGQMTSNDCFGMPDSNCMGLAYWRSYPGPGPAYHNVVPKAWGWRAPGCYSHISSQTASRSC